MRRIATVALLVLISPASTPARDRRESWAFGVTGAIGIPAPRLDLRVSVPMRPKLDFDLSAGHLAGNLGGDARFGPVYITDLRWRRGGRAPSGASRFWILGTHLVGVRTSTRVVFSARDTRDLVTHKTLVVPRFGYGWDKVTRRGVRAGLELTRGAAGEQQPFVFANAFLMWGPPRR